jgi:mono/diheme cytochrome c family protein
MPPPASEPGSTAQIDGMAKKHIRIAAATLALLGSSQFCFEAAALDALQKRGQVLARGLCGGCHAIGKNDESPHIAAPPMRALDRQIDLDKLSRRLRGGLLGTHRDMPMFRFSRNDADALVAYLRTLQGP